MKKEDDKPDWVEKMFNKVFSNEPITRGELIRIIITVILIVVIVYFGLRTTCTLDCSVCEHTGQVITQRGFGG